MGVREQPAPLEASRKPSCTQGQHPVPGAQRQKHLGGLRERICQVHDSAAHLSVPRALCSILQTWLQRYPGHFHQADDLSCLKKLVAYVAANMPDTDFELQATNLLMELEYKKYKEMVDELDSKAASEGEAN